MPKLSIFNSPENPYIDEVLNDKQYQVIIQNNEYKPAAIEWCNKNISLYPGTIWCYTVDKIDGKSIFIIHANSLNFLMHFRLMGF